MYINLTDTTGQTHIAYVNVRPTMSDTVQNIKIALTDHYDEAISLPESLEDALKSRDHNELTFICEVGEWTYEIIASDGWVY